MLLHKTKFHNFNIFVMMICIAFSCLQCTGTNDDKEQKNTDNNTLHKMRLFSLFKTPEQVKTISAKEFKEIIKKPEVQLIDVRTLDEYNAGTIDGAILIDVSSRNFLEKVQKELDSSKPVAVFCRSGARSMKAARLLSEKGFPVIYNLKGGMLGWR